MAVIIFVPGFMGTEIFTQSDQLNLWVNIPRLVAGQVGKLGLATDGISPQPPWGAVCLPGAPLGIKGGTDYYLTALSELQKNIATSDVLRVFPFDWRLDLNLAAQALAAYIQAQVPPGDVCRIAAHSVGGIVARLAWKILAAAGQSSLVARIVCLGTPHYGSYAAFQALYGDYSVIKVLYYLTNAIGSRTVLGPDWSTSSLAALVATWPGIYQLLPSLSQPGVTGGDPLRPQMYYASNWPVQQSWLNAARTFQIALADPSTLPPVGVLTVVAGTGFPTPNAFGFGVKAPFGQASPVTYGTDIGDGTVTAVSAVGPGRRQYLIPCEHFFLPLQTALDGNLIDWLYDNANTPATTTVPGNAAAATTAPPGIPVPSVVSPSTFVNGLGPKTLPAVAAGGGHAASSGPGRGRRR